MREKILSLLSSLEKGDNVCAKSFFFAEDGQIRPWLFTAFESFISSVAQLPLQERSLPTVSAFERKGSLSISSQENAPKGASSCLQSSTSYISQLPYERKDSPVGSAHDLVAKNGSSSCSDIEKKRRQTESSQPSKTPHGNEGKQTTLETSFLKEKEARKEEFFNFIQQAINKGNIVLKDDDFLEQCSNFLKFDYCHEDKHNRITSKMGNEVMVASDIVDDIVDACAAGKEVGFLASNGQERRKKDGKGPEVNNPPDNSDYAVNNASFLPMLQVDRFPEMGGTKGADQGQKAISPGGLRIPYADIVKGSNQPPIHVRNQAISNLASLHYVPCMGNSAEVDPAVQSVSSQPPRHCSLAHSKLADLESEKHKQTLCPPVNSNNATIAPFQQAVSDKNNDNPDSPASSKEEIPLLKIDNEVFNKRMSLCKYSIIGKVSLAKGEEPWTVQKLRSKLEGIWKLHSAWRLIGLGKGFFQILLLSQDEWDKVWARGMILLKPGTLRLQRWSINFDPLKEKTTNAQVWFRIFQLPWGLWDPNVISGIASKVGVPLKIDNATLNGDFGYFARVLVDVDMSSEPISEVHLECGNHKIKVKLSPENLPSFCNNCHTIGHCSDECRHLIQKSNMSWQPKQKRGGEPELPIAGIVCTKVSKTDPATSRRKEPTLSHNKAGNEVECIDEILGSNRVESLMDVRIVDVSVMNEVLNAMGEGKQVHQVPDNRSPRVEMINNEVLTRTTSPVSQDANKRDSNNGKSVHTSRIESPNRFSALSEKVEEGVVESALPYHSVRYNGGSQASDEEEFRISSIPERWSDILDEEDANEKTYPFQEANEAIMRARAIYHHYPPDISEFRARLNDVWVNRDDSRFDRDTFAEPEPATNSANSTRAFIAHIPKKDKKIKMGFRKPQGRTYSPKG